MSKVQTHLIIGSENQTLLYAQKFIQKKLCTSKGCGNCWACQAVIARQHHSLLWIAPEKNYTRDTVESVFHRLSFARNPEQPFFFVLEAVDFFSPAVGNSLLKSLEEPPAGYHFLLLAGSKERVMPTILSRCVVNELEHVAQESEYAHFLQFFLRPDFSTFSRFQKELLEVAKQDRVARKIVDEIFQFWAEEFLQATSEGDQERINRAQKACEIIKKSMERPPMPGSAKLFFRNLYMQLCDI